MLLPQLCCCFKSQNQRLRTVLRSYWGRCGNWFTTDTELTWIKGTQSGRGCLGGKESLTIQSLWNLQVSHQNLLWSCKIFRLKIKSISFFKSSLSLCTTKWQNRPDSFFISIFFKPPAVTFKNLTLILCAREIITHSQLLSLGPVNECYIMNRSRATGWEQCTGG